MILHCPELGRDIAPLLARVPDAIVFRSARTPNGHDGCLAGHKAIVRMAIDEGWSGVFLMEDDCQFTPAFSRDQWDADVEWAGRNGYDVVTGGSVSTKNARQVRPGLFAVDRFKSTHCIAYLPPAYDVVRRLVFPIDLMIGRLGARPLVTFPFVALQRPGFSGLLERFIDYTPEYDRHAAHLAALVSA